MQEPPKEIRIDLRKNFRSRQEVTEAVNFICAQIMKKQVGNVEYDQKAALYAAAAYPPPAENPLLYQTELLIATQSPESEQMESNKAQQRTSSTGMQVKYSAQPSPTQGYLHIQDHRLIGGAGSSQRQ